MKSYLRLNDPDTVYAEVRALPSGGATEFLGLTVDREWRLLREIKCQTGDGAGDGADAKVWVSRWPAQFYRLTTGDIEITTGSGSEMGVLMLALAEAIADGMIGFSLGTERKEASDAR